MVTRGPHMWLWQIRAGGGVGLTEIPPLLPPSLPAPIPLPVDPGFFQAAFLTLCSSFPWPFPAFVESPVAMPCFDLWASSFALSRFSITAHPKESRQESEPLFPQLLPSRLTSFPEEPCNPCLQQAAAMWRCKTDAWHIHSEQ